VVSSEMTVVTVIIKEKKSVNNNQLFNKEHEEKAWGRNNDGTETWDIHETEQMMQDVVALGAITLTNMAIQYLHIFRCYEALRLAARAADMATGAMPENHLLVQQILRVLSRIQSITEVNTRVRSAVLAKEGSK